MEPVSWWDPGACVEEAGGEMNVSLRRHVRPSKWTWKPSSKQWELRGVNKRSQPGRVLGNRGGREGAATEVGGKPEFSISRGWPLGQTLLQISRRGARRGGHEIWGSLEGSGGRCREGRPQLPHRDLPLPEPWPCLGEGALGGHRQPGPSSPASPPPPLSALCAGWACAGRLAHCQQLFLPQAAGSRDDWEGTGPN